MWRVWTKVGVAVERKVIFEKKRGWIFDFNTKIIKLKINS